MQFQARFESAAEEGRDDLDCATEWAVHLQNMHPVERLVRQPRDAPLNRQSAADQIAHQAAHGGKVR